MWVDPRLKIQSAFLGFPQWLTGKESTALQETQEMWVWSLHWEHPLEKGMATHPSILAWRIPGTEGPGGRQLWTHRVRHGWSDGARPSSKTCLHITQHCPQFTKAEFSFWNRWDGLSAVGCCGHLCVNSLWVQACKVRWLRVWRCRTWEPVFPSDLVLPKVKPATSSKPFKLRETWASPAGPHSATAPAWMSRTGGVRPPLGPFLRPGLGNTSVQSGILGPSLLAQFGLQHPTDNRAFPGGSG